MAKVLKSFDFKTGVASASKYPWNEWLDGRIWEITQGEDYSIKPISMAQNVWKAARDNGKASKIKIIGNRIVFKARAATQQGADHVETVPQAQ